MPEPTEALQPDPGALSAVWDRHRMEALETLGRIDRLAQPISAAAAVMAQSLHAGGRILTGGNGGSAAEASHFAAELSVRFIKDRRALGAVCLNDSTTALTAAANDFGYDRILARQIEALGRPGDVAVLFTTSGNSSNVVAALEQAKAMGLTTVTLLGKDGGACKGRADHEVFVPSPITARVQEVHLMTVHAWCTMIESALGLD